jgi:hypothetical protein
MVSTCVVRCTCVVPVLYLCDCVRTQSFPQHSRNSNLINQCGFAFPMNRFIKRDNAFASTIKLNRHEAITRFFKADKNIFVQCALDLSLFIFVSTIGT